MLAIVRPFADKLRAAGVDPDDVIGCEVGVSLDHRTTIKVKVKPRAHVVELIVTKLEVSEGV